MTYALHITEISVNVKNHALLEKTGYSVATYRNKRLLQLLRGCFVRSVVIEYGTTIQDRNEHFLQWLFSDQYSQIRSFDGSVDDRLNRAYMARLTTDRLHDHLTTEGASSQTAASRFWSIYSVQELVDFDYDRPVESCERSPWGFEPVPSDETYRSIFPAEWFELLAAWVANHVDFVFLSYTGSTSSSTS